MGCEVCGLDHAIETCSLLGHFFPVSDTPTLSYARLSLPDGLVVKDLINESKTVIATKIFLRGVQFGPFQASCTSTLPPSISFPLKIFLKNGDHVFLKTDEEHFSNWMCFVSTATSIDEVNMYCYQRDQEIYFSVTKDLLPGSELKVWYSPHYAKIMNVAPLPSDSCLAEPDMLIEPYTEAIGDHQYINKKKKREKKWKPTDGDINWQLPERIKGKLPAEMLGAVKPVNEWKCHICKVIEPNVASYARHLIHHLNILHRAKCNYCNIKRNGKHERTCKLFLFNQGLSDGSDLSEEDRRKANTLPKTKDLINNNTLSDVTNSLNRVKTADNIQLSEPLIVKETTSLIDTNKPTDNLPMNCDKDNDYVNYQFEIMNNNKNNLNIQVSDFFGKTVWNNDSGVSIDNVIGSNNLVPLTDSNLSLKERQLELNPPILDLSDEIEFQSLKNFSDTIDSNLEKQFSICRNVECPDLFDNVAVSNLLSGVDNMSTTTEQFPIFSLDKSEFLQQKFDASLEVTDEDKNRLVENLLKETDDRMNVSVYDVTDGDELKGDDDGELVTQDQSKVQEESLKKKENEASEVFACDICEKKSFRKLTYLVRHLRKHTGDFSCKFCMNIFARKETLLSHKCLSEINAEYRKERCGICNVVLYSAMELSSHIAYHYCTYSKWECKHCRLISEDVEKLDKHFCLQSNGLKRQFSCDNCNKLFSTSTEFTEHREEVNVIKTKGVKENKTICEVCGIVMNKKTFKIHRHIHNGKRFECKECGMKFSRKDSLQIHKLKHSLPKFSCSVCEKKFKCKKYLDKHVLSHTKNHVLKFSCEHCNKKFNHKHHMLVHVQNHFGKFICDLCRKVFSSKISLKRHSIIHTHETTFQCTLCDRRFYKEKKMFAHRRTFHSADYTCHYCNVKIAYRQSLKRHLTSRHLNSKHEWDVEGALDSMKTTLNYTDEEQMEEENLSSDEQMQEENFEPSDEQMQEENFKASEPQAAEVVDRDGLPDLGNDVSTIQVADSQNLVTLSKERVLDLMNSTSNISVTDSQDLIAMSKEKLLDLVNVTSNIAVTGSQDLIAMSKERLFDLVNGTSNIPVTDSEDLITLSKERLLELLNGTSDVNTSQDLIELSKEGLLDLANGATDIPVTQAQELVGLNVDNITVNVLWTNVENEQLAESETLTTKNDSIVPMVQLTAPEEFIGLNVDNSCIDNGIGTYILEDGRIMNEDVQLGGDIFFYVVEPTTDEQELLFV